MKWDSEKGQWQRSSENGPPDLEQIVKNFFKGSPSEKPSKSSGHSFEKFGLFGFILITLLYVLSGFYVVLESESGLLLRLGKIHQELTPGWHWHAPWVERVYIINTQMIDSFKKESMMLTEDENMVYAGFEIQYRRKDIRAFLFKDRNPILSLHQLTESCIREVIGHSTLDEILTTGKQSITRAIADLIGQSLQNYQLGVEILDVNLSFVLPPEPVLSAFNEVIKAREDEQAYQNEALRYRESQIPVAMGHAQRIMLEASGYSEEKIFKAQAETQAFIFLAKQDKLFPELMRKRLYHETIDVAMKNPRKILVDPSLSTPLLSLGSIGGTSCDPKHHELKAIEREI
jgi:membrane protease subunit HflK